MWQRLHRRTYLVLAVVLVLTFAAGLMSHTAYARYQQAKIKTWNFNTTFSGVTPPLSEMSSGTSFDVELVGGGKFLNRKRAKLNLALVVAGNQILPAPQTQGGCGKSGASGGWCATSRGHAFLFEPQFFSPGIPVGNALLATGPGKLTKLDTENDVTGMATFNVLIEKPENPEDGVKVIANLEGFAAKTQLPEKYDEVEKAVKEAADEDD